MSTFEKLMVVQQRFSVVHKRGLPWLLAALTVLLTLPSLWTGYYQDDHLIRLRFQGFPGLPGVTGKLLDTCVFGDGDPDQTRVRMERGIFPWWTPNDWKIAFWRPLTGATHWLDWRLFGDCAWLMHLHSLLWYGLLVALLTRLYQRLLTPHWIAGLAGLLYLLDAAHAVPVTWIATRNAALSSVFVVLVLYFHDRGRRDGWRPGSFAAVAALILGLLGSEAAVAVGGYLAAYALFLDRGRWPARIASLLPYLTVVVIWRAVYQALGYGVTGSMLYTDPFKQPVTLVLDTLRYLPSLVFCQLAASDPAIWNFVPPLLEAVYLASAVAFLLFVTYVLWPMLRRDAVARFWALGMVLSALPVCTTMPQGRELMNPGIGAMALIAQFLGSRWATPPAESETPVYRRMAKALAVLWIVLHLAVSSVALPVNSYTGTVKQERVAQHLNDGAPSDPRITSDTLLIVNTPADLLGSTLPVMRAANGEPVPKYGRLLCAGVRSLEIERLDERALRFRLDDLFLTRPWTQVFRNPATHPMQAGQTVRLTGLEAQVVSATKEGRPKEVLFRFDVPLEDPSLRWVVFKDRTYAPFTPPPVGKTIHVNGPSFPDIVRWFLGR
jgi:hypothetical protein